MQMLAHLVYKDLRLKPPRVQIWIKGSACPRMFLLSLIKNQIYSDETNSKIETPFF